MKVIRTIIKLFKNIFIGFVQIIDKLVIANISRWFFKIQKALFKNDKTFESILYRTNALIFMSLVLALLLFFIIDSRVISITNSSAEIFANQPIIAEYNQEEYAIEGIPKTVTVMMVGKTSDLYLAKQLPMNAIKLDLSDLKEGTHRVTIKYNQNLGNVRYVLDPSVITVNVYQKQSITKTVGVDILNIDDLNAKLVIDKVELSRDEVLIKGPKYKLDRIASVKALIDVKDLPNQTLGTITIPDVALVAYDQNGVKVGVNIIPNKINAEVTIVSPVKEVPIKVIPVGKVVFGKAISTIESSVIKVRIYGDENILEKINYVPVKIDVNGLSKNKEYNVAIKKPVGIRSMSANNITIYVSLGIESSKELKGVSIEYQNLSPGLSVQAASAADTSIAVIVKGDQSILNKLDQTTVRAFVDLKGYKTGKYDVPVEVTGDDARLVYQAKTKKVTLNIIKNS